MVKGQVLEIYCCIKIMLLPRVWPLNWILGNTVKTWCGWLRWYPCPNATLLCGWIRFSPIVNPVLHLIFLYIYCLISLYKFRCYFLKRPDNTESQPTCFGVFIVVYSKVYTLPVIPIQTVYIHGMFISHSSTSSEHCYVKNVKVFLNLFNHQIKAKTTLFLSRRLI